MLGKHTYNLLKWKAELLRVKRGRRGRVRGCNYLSGQPADLQVPESWGEFARKRSFLVCFFDFEAGVCFGALSFSSLFGSFLRMMKISF